MDDSAVIGWRKERPDWGRHGPSATRIFGRTATRAFSELGFAGIGASSAAGAASRIGSPPHPSPAPGRFGTLACSRGIPIVRNPEIPKALFSESLALVLDVIVVDLEPVLTKRDQDLIPDRNAGFRVAEAQPLHHILRDLGGKRRLRRAASRWSETPFIRPRRKCIRIDDADSPLLNAANISVVGFKLGRGGKTRIIGSHPRRRAARLLRGRRQIRRVKLRAAVSCWHDDLQAAAAAADPDWISAIISSNSEMKFLAALDSRSCKCGM